MRQKDQEYLPALLRSKQAERVVVHNFHTTLLRKKLSHARLSPALSLSLQDPNHFTLVQY